MKEKAFESIIEKREEQPVDLDVLFVGSPVHYLPALEGKTIELGYPLGEIPNGLLHMATFLKENELSSRILPLDPFLRQEQLIFLSKSSEYWKKVSKNTSQKSWLLR
ncbi:MAG: hypothetical protein JZU67_00015 [Burkholderiaceae bacterium]|nr:hypothetical protein [Burkholderiaceae bacterium]